MESSSSGLKQVRDYGVKLPESFQNPPIFESTFTSTGDTVLDMCSAPGGKSFAIASSMNNEGSVYSYDLYDHRINLVNDGKATITQEDIDELKAVFSDFLIDVLGVRTDIVSGENANVLEPFEKAVDLLLDIRKESKVKKDWATSDLIRDRLDAIGFNVKDTKDGFEWSLKM